MNQPELQRTEDFDLIEKMAREIWYHHYVPMIGLDQVDYMLDKFYRKEALEYQRKEGQEFWLIGFDAENCGYIGVSRQNPNEYFIHKFYLHTGKHRKGIGSKAFTQLTEFYNDATIIRLQVNINNFKSINFYFKCGFTIEKRLVLEIGGGYVMDDYIMIWKRP